MKYNKTKLREAGFTGFTVLLMVLVVVAASMFVYMRMTEKEEIREAPNEPAETVVADEIETIEEINEEVGIKFRYNSGFSDVRGGDIIESEYGGRFYSMYLYDEELGLVRIYAASDDFVPGSPGQWNETGIGYHETAYTAEHFETGDFSGASDGKYFFYDVDELPEEPTKDATSVYGYRINLNGDFPALVVASVQHDAYLTDKQKEVVEQIARSVEAF